MVRASSHETRLYCFLLTNYLCAALKTFSSLFAAVTLGLAFWLPNYALFTPVTPKLFFFVACLLLN